MKQSKKFSLSRVGPYRFEAPKDAPEWALPILAQGIRTSHQLFFNDPLSFAGNFLEDAEESWSDSEDTDAVSGVFEHKASDGIVSYFHLSAEQTAGAPKLVLHLHDDSMHRPVRLARASGLELETVYASLALRGRSSESEKIEPGCLIEGGYRVGRKISSGAMGVVFCGVDENLGRTVAIKTMHPSLCEDEGLVERFYREARMLASVANPHLVQIYKLSDSAVRPFFVMEHIEGVTLSDLIENCIDPRLLPSIGEIMNIADQTALALDALNAARVVHRDVKPANIIVETSNNRAVLVDVGVSKWLGERGDGAGTPGFAAPESLQGGAETAATDVYGLAATCYAMLTGKCPYEGKNLAELLHNQLNAAPLPARGARPDLPLEVDLVLKRGMERQPESRYQSASEFSIALRRAASTKTD